MTQMHLRRPESHAEPRSVPRNPSGHDEGQKRHRKRARRRALDRALLIATTSTLSIGATIIVIFIYLEAGL